MPSLHIIELEIHTYSLLRNMSIVVEGFEQNYTTHPFHPYYLSLFSGVRASNYLNILNFTLIYQM